MVHIPIVMATDNRYIPLIVSITSMLKSAGKDTFYDIYILIDDSFTKESEFTIKRCLSVFEDRCSLSFKSVGDMFDHALVTIPHITRPTYYRLMIPELLNENKCIYLDTDTIILSDLWELFDTSLDDCYIAGVWHPGVILDRWREGICRDARVPSADQYINAGVLVMNLEKMRRDEVVERFMELIPLNMPTQDQDIINNVCYGKIAFVPFKYNVMTKFADRGIEDYKGCYSEKDLKEAWNDPYIIHYADPGKPWNSGRCAFMDMWWIFFRRSPIYRSQINNFFEELVTDIIYCSRTGSIMTKKTPKIFDLAFKRKYVIYGAGKRARDVITYLKQFEIIPEFIVVSDSEGNPSDIEGIEVRNITDSHLKMNDKSIVIAVRERLQKEIIKKLQGYDYFELLPISDSFLQ